MSTVDVVVPCYNYAHYLPFAVGSVVSQRDVDVRVLIIDDQSPDETAEVAARLCAADSRISYHRNAINLGLIGTANHGVMDWAKADYVVLLSADDALTPGALARATGVLDIRPELSMAYSRCSLLNDAHEPEILPDLAEPTWRVIDPARFIRRNFEVGNPTPSPSVIVRTSVQQAIGGYDHRFRHTSDMDMWMRCATRGPVGVIQEPGAFYRLHASNMGNEFFRQPLGDRQEIIDTCAAFVARFSDQFPEAGQWLTNLKRRYADEAYWLCGRTLEDGNHEVRAACVAFAKRHHPSPWLSAAAWRFGIKRLLGPSLMRALRRNAQADPTAADGSRDGMSSDNEACHEQRRRVGWWPEAA